MKETRLLLRDVYGLVLLFLMPTIFILVMSLALQDVFAARAGSRPASAGVKVEITDADQSEASRELARRLGALKGFTWTTGADPPRDALVRKVKAGKQTFAIIIPAGYGQRLVKSASANALTGSGPETAPPSVEVLVAPDAEKRSELIFTGALRSVMAGQRIDTALAALGPSRKPGEPPPHRQEADPLRVTYTFDAATASASPSAVQQNVPAWLVFSIFFVAVPFSQTFIRERDLGTQRRLRTTNLSAASQIFGKLIPYYAVNQVQIVLMFLIGMFVVPALGGEALQLRGDPLALALMGAAVSFAALGLALLIAAIARSSEQASMMSGLGNIILGASGGIMVPRFVMPEAMRAMSGFSPMAWGLDGFLELLLHGGGVLQVLPEIAKLAAMGVVAIAIALGLHRLQE